MADGNIVAARKKLDQAVKDLIDPKHGMYDHTMLTAPSLYAQICSDLAGTQGDTRTPAKSLPPLWVDAAQLIFDMDSQVHRWCPVPGTTPQRLHILAIKSWRPQDTDHVTGIARTVEDWTRKIVSLLDPQAQKTINAACPSCGRKTVYRKDSAGETVRQAALRLVANDGCTCQHCDAHWPPEKYMFLQKLLGLAPTEGVCDDETSSR